ncbi:MAG: GNAT family N-acetyltransferase [Colwellia sp.]
MAENAQYSYHALSFTEFIDLYKVQDKQAIPKARLFELTLPWLEATRAYMLPKNSHVIVHCLFQDNAENAANEPTLTLAWPLIHKKVVPQHSVQRAFLCGKNKTSPAQISSLSSFYASIAEPIFFTPPVKENVKRLFSYITQQNPWRNMQLGPFEPGVMTQALVEYFPYQRKLSTTGNVYQTGISGYAEYYQQRPSQLRNTLKRRAKKLVKAHAYRTEIITHIEHFSSAFEAYKTIYQQSWKGDEFSFKFIEQVCLAALAENKLRLGLLFVDDEPVAAQLWFLQSFMPLSQSFPQKYSKLSSGQAVNGNHVGSDKLESLQTTASIFKLAYLPQYQQYSVGSLLSLALSEHVIIQDKVSSIEFGMGSEPYKKDWLSEYRTREIYQVFNSNGIYGKLAIIRKLILSRLVNFFIKERK